MVVENIDSFNWEETAWKILKTMMKETNFLIQHQINHHTRNGNI